MLAIVMAVPKWMPRAFDFDVETPDQNLRCPRYGRVDGQIGERKAENQKKDRRPIMAYIWPNRMAWVGGCQACGFSEANPRSRFQARSGSALSVDFSVRWIAMAWCLAVREANR